MSTELNYRQSKKEKKRGEGSSTMRKRYLYVSAHREDLSSLAAVELDLCTCARVPKVKMGHTLNEQH